MLHPDMRERLGEDKVAALAKAADRHHSVAPVAPVVEQPARRRHGFLRRAAATLTPSVSLHRPG
jgi:hypothetical protein